MLHFELAASATGAPQTSFTEGAVFAGVAAKVDDANKTVTRKNTELSFFIIQMVFRPFRTSKCFE